jgi:hypothetical protein
VKTVVAGVTTLTKIHTQLHKAAHKNQYCSWKMLFPKHTFCCMVWHVPSYVLLLLLRWQKKKIANNTSNLVTSKIKMSYHAKTLQNFSPSLSPGPLLSSHCIYFVKCSMLMVEVLLNDFSYVKLMSRTHMLQLQDCTSNTTTDRTHFPELTK